MVYQFGDIVYGVTDYTGSTFALTDFCLGMVVETKEGIATRILILNSRYIDTKHQILNSEDFAKRVRDVRRDPNSYEESSLKRGYGLFALGRTRQHQSDFRYVTPTQEGFDQMTAHVKKLLVNRRHLQEPDFISFPEFRRRFLSNDFESTKTAPTLYL